MSTRDYLRPQRPGRPYRGETGRLERYERERSLREQRDQSDGSDDPYGLYRPAGGGPAGTTVAPPGTPARHRSPGSPGRPGGPGRHGIGDGGGGDGFVRRLLRGPWTLKKIAAIAGAVFGSGIALVAILFGVAYAQTPIPTAPQQAALQQDSVVYFSDGKTVVGTFGSTDRQILSYDQIPAVMRDAVLAAEDRNFYHEGGVSVTGTLRAFYNDVSGGSIQGGSTITQQFVRNYYQNIGTQQTLSRKLKEIFVSMKLARQKSKAWILTQYLNTIYLGNGAYGVGAAAQVYFGVPAQKLTVSQAAVIAAIIQSPSYYPTAAGRQALVARWHYVLDGMVTLGDLTPQQEAATRFPKFTPNQQLGNGWSGYSGYIMQAVQSELETTYHYQPNQLTGGGLRVVTTFDKAKMDALYRAVQQNEKLMKEGGRALPSYAHVGAMLEDPHTGAIVAMYSGPGYDARNCAKIKCQFDMALQNREQVGSSFKPYVLATARQQGMNVKTSILDGSSPLCVPPDSAPMVYSVPGKTCPSSVTEGHVFANDPGDSGIGGPQSVEYATAQSLNTAYTDLTHRVGTSKVIEMAREFGVDTNAYDQGGSGLSGMSGQVGIALGQAAITVEEQANTFATLANDGQYVSPHVIASIRQGAMVVHPDVIHREVLTPGVASDVDWALSFDTTRGTAVRAAMADGRPVIGKTGTTDTAQSAFFIGAIPQYSLAVGIFTNDQNGQANDPESLNMLGGLPGGGYGGDWPSMIWHTFAETAFAPLQIENFPPPVFGGVKWNLFGALPAPHRHLQPGPRPACGPFNFFCKRRVRKSPTSCLPGVLLPGCPPPSPSPPPPSPSPSLSPPTFPPKTGATTQGLTIGFLAALPALRRARRRLAGARARQRLRGG